MIPRTIEILQPSVWQSELARAVSSLRELLRLLDLDSHPALASVEQARQFPLRVPRGYVSRMRRGDAHDPLLLQVLPRAEEYLDVTGYGVDPVGDDAAHTATGVLHKYHGRALLIATGACAIHCRYCFRRHFPYAEANARSDAWRPALDYLHAHEDINEVILSGGDPLVLADRHLSTLVTALGNIPHLKRLRIHTRLPIVLPERIDDQLLAWVTTTRLQAIVVIHANHAQEIDDQVRRSIARLRQAGVCILNQSVLLAGVNDELETLVELSEALFDMDVLPYYLHVLDKVAGAAHFDLTREVAIGLHRGMLARLPGYLVPKLVTEKASMPHKIWLADDSTD